MASERKRKRRRDASAKSRHSSKRLFLLQPRVSSAAALLLVSNTSEKLYHIAYLKSSAYENAYVASGQQASVHVSLAGPLARVLVVLLFVGFEQLSNVRHKRVIRIRVGQ